MPTQTLGKVKLTPRGAYDPAATYVPLDIVSYGGGSYCVLKNVTGVTPTGDDVNYQLLAKSGADGKSPQISASKTWLVWDANEGEYVDTGVSAAGEIPEVDDTLTQPGQAADAAAVGDRLSALSEEIASITGVHLVEPAEDDIPKVYFTGTLPTSKSEGDLQLIMRYISKTADFVYPVTLKVQGASSTKYAKKNFTLKLYEDDTYVNKVKLAFRNWGKLNKFVLKAHWMDHSHVRNVGTARIWGKIVESRSDYASLPEELRNAPNNGATDGFTVKVFVNGVYQGLYEWIVPKDKLFGQDGNNVNHSIMNSELNDQPSCAFSTTSPVISGNWSEELQDSMSNAISTSFANFIRFVAGSTDEEFVANAENYFDVQSVIDFDIFARVFCIVDNLCRNQIFFTYDGTKWYEGCWDVDAVLGLPPTASGFFEYNTEFQTGYIAYRDNGMTNMLYQRVENLFRERFKARYAELRAGVLSVENIIESYERLTDVITRYDGLLAEDFAATTADGAFTAIPYTTTNNIQQIRNFAAKRLVYMDEVIDAMIVPVPATGITLSAYVLTFDTADSQTLTATVEPENSTDKVIWTSSEESVAIVSDGVVTPVSKGSAVITARAGSYSAECSVTVNVEAETVTYTITRTLSNCETDSSVTTVAENASHTETLTAANGYTMDGASVSITMGGVDISTSYTNGVLTIGSVTGNVVIVASAAEAGGEVTLLKSITGDGESYINTGVIPVDGMTYEYAVQLNSDMAYDNSTKLFLWGADQYISYKADGTHWFKGFAKNPWGGFGLSFMGGTEASSSSLEGSGTDFRIHPAYIRQSISDNVVTHDLFTDDAFSTYPVGGERWHHETKTYTGSKVLPMIPLYLFYVNRASDSLTDASAYTKQKFTLFFFRVKDYTSGNVLHEFVPAKKGSMIGMYDTVNNVFFKNQGTGVFTYEEVESD